MTDTFGVMRYELLQVAEAVAREKNIDREEVLEAMENAIQKAGKAKYGLEHDIRATIDRKTSEIVLHRYRAVVDQVEDESTQLSLKDAHHYDKDLQLGDFLIEALPPIDFGRVAAQSAKQVIIQRVRDAERQRQYEEYKDRAGEIVNGVVKRADFGNVLVDLGRAEGLLRRSDMLPRESFRVGDRIRAYIYDVRPEVRGAQIFLSRTHPQFMAKLFTQEVPEIYDGLIEIKAVARDPGSRAKIAVHSRDPSMDPVGSCVGLRGARVQAVVGELQGEKIDIIPWSSDIGRFVVNAMAPAEIAKVVVDEDAKRLDVIVPEEQLSLAIGRRGQNVRLASMLTDWKINLMTEAQEIEKRAEEMERLSRLFTEALDVDDSVAQLLVVEGFGSVEDIALIDQGELASIEGFDEEIGAELQTRANNHLKAEEKRLKDQAKKLGLHKDVMALEGLAPTMLLQLAESGIQSLDDFADLSGDELRDIVGVQNVTQDQADALIMKAREHWFKDEEQA